MKVSVIWRLLSLFILGFALGLFVSYRYISKNMPAGQSIEIGRVKVKGKGTEIQGPVISINQDQVNQEGEKKKRRRRRH